MNSPPVDPFDIVRTDALTPEERADVLKIEQAAAAIDQASPLDDQVRLDLEFSPRPGVLHLLARTPATGRIVGYAHLIAAADAPGSAHVAVDPDARRRGVGTALIERLAAEADPRALQVWAHGDEAAARFLSGRLGFRRVRDLWKMAVPLTSDLARPTYPGDVSVRAFSPGRDDEPWVALNARAFAEHPEQGKITVEGLHQRMEQPWFDPAGLFLAERDGRPVGFHWTKVHPADATHDRPVGEVYAVGVDPDAQGLGLGTALTLTGLVHLRSRGLTEATLYVEADNVAAVAVYEKIGFRRIAVDVMYERP